MGANKEIELIHQSLRILSILNQKLTWYSLCFRGFVHLGAGLAVGLSGLAAGYAIGIVGDAGVRGTAQQPRLFVGMILILIFAEVLGLYGLIVAIYLYAKQMLQTQRQFYVLEYLCLPARMEWHHYVRYGAKHNVLSGK